MVLGVVHSVLSFKKFEHFTAEAFWFLVQDWRLSLQE